jgi:hypothetical protein
MQAGKTSRAGEIACKFFVWRLNWALIARVFSNLEKGIYIHCHTAE